jgi:hypothetical protein
MPTMDKSGLDALEVKLQRATSVWEIYTLLQDIFRVDCELLARSPSSLIALPVRLYREYWSRLASLTNVFRDKMLRALIGGKIPPIPDHLADEVRFVCEYYHERYRTLIIGPLSRDNVRTALAKVPVAVRRWA